MSLVLSAGSCHFVFLPVHILAKPELKSSYARQSVVFHRLATVAPYQFSFKLIAYQLALLQIASSGHFIFLPLRILALSLRTGGEQGKNM